MRRRVVAALRVVLVPLTMLAASAAGAAESPPSATAGPEIFATVGETVITYKEYNAAFTLAARDKFYHGRPPDAEVALLQRQVAGELVSRVLLLAEARRRGLQPDEQVVQRAVADADRRYAGNERWKQERAQVLPELVQRIEQNSLLQQLERSVRDSAVPTPQQLADYYAAHPDKFTQPEQLRAQVILIKVDPSSPRAEWDRAQQEAQAILQQVRDGADFADIARERSGDQASAPQGGDLGYRHVGMLPDNVQAALKELQPGDLSVPVFLMEGFAVFRLNERKPAALTPFEAATERVRELAQREQGDTLWKALAASLKQRTSATIDESRYLPLPQAPVEATATK